MKRASELADALERSRHGEPRGIGNKKEKGRGDAANGGACAAGGRPMKSSRHRLPLFVFGASTSGNRYARNAPFDTMPER
jgi:hypothetical protein